MTSVDSPPPLETLDLVILVRLLQPATATKARQDVGKMMAARLSLGEWNTMFDARWQTLLERQLVGPQPGKKPGKTLALTDAGRSRVLEFLHIAELPAKLTWATLQSGFLLPLALGLRPGSTEARRLNSAPQLKLTVIARAKQLPLGEHATAKAVLAALAWKLIGVESEAGFTAENVIQQLAFGQLPGRKITATQMTNALAASAVGSTKTTLADLRLAALRQWLFKTPENVPTSHADDLELFAGQVIDAARQCPSAARFGDNKVFISHVWRQMIRPSDAALDLDRFKQRLLEANRDGLLQLSRADLVEAMDPVDVRESLTVYDNATFHFVRI
jgi:hypothetical protein